MQVNSNVGLLGESMRFSERSGFRKVAEIIQIDEMNDSLRTSIWNCFYDKIFSEQGFINSYQQYDARIYFFSKTLWQDYFKKPIDSRPQYGGEIFKEIREYFFSCPWYEVYDFIEFMILKYKFIISFLNDIFLRELSGYRIINSIVAPISTNEEISTIETAITDNLIPVGARSHLQQALQLLSNKESPDYRNSIKESISAVESICKCITQKDSATLGEALILMEKKHGLHKALKDAFSKLYGYTSDSNGIRHAMLDETIFDQSDAIYFLVSCSAFINYLKSKNIE